jgi:ubiquinone/menaquinone biosynthesis C-methylase UbiE
VGITKHMGGLEATRELLKLCKVDDSDYLLVLGSGNGVSAIKIHRMTGCRVVGIDISKDMVERAREKLEPGVEFVVGDAENIDFPDNTFDVVISESVTGFTDKTRSIPEYHRVLKDGGYIGLNEVTWLEDPSPEMDAYCQRVMGLVAESRDGWISLLKAAGFKDITSSLKTMSQWKQLVGDLELQSMDFLRIWGRFFHLYLHEGEYRKSVHQLAWEALHIPRGFSRYLGYGLYTGIK